MPHYRLHRDPRSSHQQIAGLIQSLKLSPILDVGAAQGMLGHLIEAVVMVVADHGADEDWGTMCYPPLSPSRLKKLPPR